MIDNKLIKVILLGPPGSGKGSLAQELSKANFIQISTGDLFRKKLEGSDSEAKMIQSLITRGELIPDEIVNKLATDAILEASKDQKNIILDGFPRTIEQAKYLEKVTTIDYVIYLNIDDDILLKRITGRLTCSQCHKIYNIYSNPPKEKELCDNCLIPLSKRRDDNKESFQQRIHEYKTKTYPLIEYYKNQNSIKFVEIKQDDNTSTDQVLNEVLSKLNK